MDLIKKYVIGIDLGGTKISTALADENGQVISSTTVATNAVDGENAVLNRIISTVEKVIQEGNIGNEEIKAIGIGSPGPLDSEKGMIICTPNLPFVNFDLVTPLKSKFNTDVYLDNDANVATIGEYMLGAGKGSKNCVFFTVSTGVGGGAIIDGKIYRGSTSNALEIGHTTVAPFGPRCNCGNIGCLEAVSSGTAIGKRGRDAISSKVGTSLRKYNEITSFEVFTEAKNGDKVAIQIIDEALTYLGIGVANAITIFDPDVVIIGGGVSKAGEIVFDKVKEVVNTRCFKSMAEHCEVVPAALGTDAGVIGAVALAILESN